MTRAYWVTGLALLAAGCAIGPGGHRPTTTLPPAYRPQTALEDSMRAVYDSLALSRDSMASRKRDTSSARTSSFSARTDTSSARTDSSEARTDATAKPKTHLNFTLSDSAANITWFDLFQDTVLTHLVAEAVNNNRDVRVAVATIREYQEDLGVATAGLGPAFTANGQSGRNKQVFGPTFSIPAFNYLEVTGNVSWELDFWGRLRNTRTAARDDLLSEEQSRRSVVLTLVSNVATGYLQLRQLDLELEVARRTLVSRQETFRLASERLSRGYISELDVRQFQGDVGDAASSVANYQKQVAQQENRLSLLLGQVSGPIPRGRPLNDVLADVELPVGVPSALIERRPDIRQSEAQFQAASARIGAALDARLPKFTVNGDWGYEGLSTGQYFPTHKYFAPTNNTYQVYLGVSIPIFDFGVLAHQQHAAEARAVEARYSYERTVLTAVQDVNNYLAEVRNDRDQVIALQTEVEALRIAYQLSKDRYDAGYSQYLDVLTAERSLFVAEQALITAQAQALIGVVDLYQSLGGGWPIAGKKEAGGRTTSP